MARRYQVQVALRLAGCPAAPSAP